MPVFTKTLKTIDYADPKSIKDIANHIRVMQEELEYRLAHLDSANISEINANDTKIFVNGENILNRIESEEGNYSELVQTVEGFRMEVARYEQDVNGFRQQVSRYEQTVDGFATTVESYEQTLEGYSGQLSSYQQTVAGFESTVQSYEQSVNGYSQQVSSFQQTVNGFNTTVSNYEKAVNGYASEVSSLKQTSNSIQASVTSLSKQMSTTLRLDSSGVYITDANGATVSINGGQIAANSISSRAIKLYGLMAVYLSESSNTVGGYIGYQSSTSGYGAGMAMVNGNSMLAVSSGGVAMRNNSYGAEQTQVSVTAAAAGIRALGVNYAFDSSTFYTDGKCTLGSATNVWGQIYTSNNVSVVSDRNAKWDINYDFDERYDAFWSLLKPCTGKYMDGTSGRDHMFLISQDVEEALAEAGLTSYEFGGFIKSPNDEGDGYVYSLRYEEFIPLAIRQIQKLQAEVAALKGG